MNNIIGKMVKIYGLTDYCFMGYKASSESYFTYHHLIKKCEGGPRTVENGAILTREAHRYLNIIEKTEYDIYHLINNILIEINLSKEHPTINHWKRINYLLREYEKLHSYDTNYYQEMVIKDTFKERVLIKIV